MGWSLKLDREREWPAGTKVVSLVFRDPTLRDMRALPEIETVRTFEGVTSYGIDWDALARWLELLCVEEAYRPLINQLSPAESQRAKDDVLGFFGSAVAAPPLKTPPTTSASEPSSDRIRID